MAFHDVDCSFCNMGRVGKQQRMFVTSSTRNDVWRMIGIFFKNKTGEEQERAFVIVRRVMWMTIIRINKNKNRNGQSGGQGILTEMTDDI